MRDALYAIRIEIMGYVQCRLSLLCSKFDLPKAVSYMRSALILLTELRTIPLGGVVRR